MAGADAMSDLCYDLAILAIFVIVALAFWYSDEGEEW